VDSDGVVERLLKQLQHETAALIAFLPVNQTAARYRFETREGVKSRAPQRLAAY
jgi:2-C-methyl-D-erythritol 4-phosphate cytidylyltransferase